MRVREQRVSARSVAALDRLSWSTGKQDFESGFDDDLHIVLQAAASELGKDIHSRNIRQQELFS